MLRWGHLVGPARTTGEPTPLHHPGLINLLLLGLALMAHPSMRAFLNALDEAISGASGILVQFPIYFGIMGMVTGTELGTWLADGLVGATSRAWLPVALFTSSGVLNVFVPSGGGQWAVQGPLYWSPARPWDWTCPAASWPWRTATN